MKTWQKILSAVLVITLIVSAVLLFNREQKSCCLCNSFRYHAPCLVDLQTGDLIELDLYFPHPTKVAELADPQPRMGTFSFVNLGCVTGTKLTDSKTIELDIPISEKTANPALCKSCRKQLNGLLLGRYVLADLYDSEDKKLIPIQDHLSAVIRCYRIDTQTEDDILKVTIQGILEQGF